jgi:nuclear pore complex protein Nup133
VVWPKQLTALVGAGGTHGELCVRFPLEDLREPIIKDNLLDDEILQENIDKNRLDQWSGDEEAVRRAEAEAEASGVEGDAVNGVDESKDVQMQES